MSAWHRCCSGSWCHWWYGIGQTGNAGGHLWRVGQFSKLLALQAGLSQRDVALCEIGGFLHDLGKIGVPDAILNKPDRLTDAEYDIIKTHPSVGGKLLVTHPLAKLALDAVVGHHERPDGNGYPNALAATLRRRCSSWLFLARDNNQVSPARHAAWPVTAPAADGKDQAQQPTPLRGCLKAMLAAQSVCFCCAWIFRTVRVLGSTQVSCTIWGGHCCTAYSSSKRGAGRDDDLCHLIEFHRISP